MFGLTAKELVELRIKCLEPIVATASKVGLEKGQIFDIAEEAWKYAIKPLAPTQDPQTRTTGAVPDIAQP